jgi:hypothetical protein
MGRNPGGCRSWPPAGAFGPGRLAAFASARSRARRCCRVSFMTSILPERADTLCRVPANARRRRHEAVADQWMVVDVPKEVPIQLSLDGPVDGMKGMVA